MKPRITVITLGVDDLQASLAFYRDGLGFKTEGIFGTEFEYGGQANQGTRDCVGARGGKPAHHPGNPNISIESGRLCTLVLLINY